MMSHPSVQHRAPGLFGDFWFNTEPFSIADLQGYVGLIHFWDFASMSSLRSLDYIKDWHKKYREFGLITVGVHTPGFQFGRDRERLQAAIRELGIEYPVVADNEAFVWTAYGCRTWPTTFLLNKDGFIRSSRFGVGGYVQTERLIQALLAELGFHGELPDLTNPIHDTDIPGIPLYKPSADIQTGYLRGAFGNPEGYSPESTVEYADQGIYLPGRFYLAGKWMNEREFVRFDGEPGEQGTLTVRYEASDVHVVLGSRDGKPVIIQVKQDGGWLATEKLGSDVRREADGSTAIHVSKPGVFHVSKNKEFGEYLLRLTTNNPSSQVYLVSFGTTPIPEVIHSN